MISLLSKIFIKDNMIEEDKRSAYGAICSLAGIILNVILSVVKTSVGAFSGSIAIISDGLNNLSDAAASLVALIGFKLSGKKPDQDHPYGHGRIEYIAGFIVSVLIILMAFNLLKESVVKIFNPKETVFSSWTIIILSVSILVKLYMFYYNFTIGRKISSETIKATGKDSLMDCIATFMALVSALIEHFAGIMADGYFGVIVGMFILVAGISVAKDTLNPLLGLAPEPEYVEKIKDIALNFDEKILGIHDLIVHDYGPQRRFVILHAEMSSEENVLELHEIVDALEVKLSEELRCMATVHLDPIVVNDERVNSLRSSIAGIVKTVDESFVIHDFRVVFGDKNTNLIFDVLVSFSFDHTENEIKDMIKDKVREELGDGYNCVIQVDRDMVNS